MSVDFQRDVHCLLGLPFDVLGMPAVVGRVRRAARERVQCVVATPNVNFVVAARSDSRFRDSVINSDLSLVDGMPLVWIGRLLGIPVPERASGATLFETLRKSTGERLSVFFFGGAEGAAEAACRQLKLEDAGLACAGYASPGFGSVESMSADDVIAGVNAAAADLLVVALGARKGQAWIERNRARLNVPVLSHLGAVLNFVAGRVRRAPPWMRDHGLEWLWRIREEPALWRRYAGDGFALLALMVTRVLPYAWHLRRHPPAPSELAAAEIEAIETGQCHTLRLRGAWTRSNADPLRQRFANAASVGTDVTLDMRGVNSIDSAVVALIMLLRGHLEQRGRRLAIVGIPDFVRRTLRYCCAEYLHSPVGRAAYGPAETQA